MSLQALHRPQTAGLVATAQGQMRLAGALPSAAVSTAELGETISRLAELESQAVALRLSLSAVAEVREAHHSTADSGTDAWLARLTGDTRAVPAGGLRTARLLQDRYAATREAFAAGQLRLAQVVEAAENAPAGVSDTQVAEAEELLVAKATGAANRTGRPIDARRLRQLARRMFETLSPEIADNHESDLLQAEETRAAKETWLTLHDNGDGTFSGRFVIPELHGALLTQLLHRLSAPRRFSRDQDGHRIEDTTLPGEGGLNTYEHHGQAFCEMLEHLPTAGHSGTTAQVIVTIPLPSLLTGIGAARLESGVAVSARQARRLACEADLVPAVLGGESVPLDLGRSRRLHTAAQRRALAIQYDSCGITLLLVRDHHPRSWSRGGPTDLDNALPLCAWHHQRAHDPGGT